MPGRPARIGEDGDDCRRRFPVAGTARPSADECRWTRRGSPRGRGRPRRLKLPQGGAPAGRDWRGESRDGDGSGEAAAPPTQVGNLCHQERPAGMGMPALQQAATRLRQWNYRSNGRPSAPERRWTRRGSPRGRGRPRRLKLPQGGSPAGRDWKGESGLGRRRSSCPTGKGKRAAEMRLRRSTRPTERPTIRRGI